MRRIQQKHPKNPKDCGVACVAMLAGCSYQQAFDAFNFAKDEKIFTTSSDNIVATLKRLGHFPSVSVFEKWRLIDGCAIVATSHKKNGDWHWVAFDGKAMIDPSRGYPGRRKDLRGIRGNGILIQIKQ
jgi:hypothetical protein